tara:strand:- start:74108 stop:74893 length:786 start_codon:yes stop_codon:yes gene_type:complete
MHNFEKKIMVYKLNDAFLEKKQQIENFIKNFDNSGKVFIKGNRNTIKLFELDKLTLNVKSFKEPNLINKIAYRYFRKSKAQRSFEYANFLLENNIGTPRPVAYFENTSLLGLKDSYYVSEHLECDLTYRELVETDYPDAENILRQFTQFTFSMHEKGIEFLDHSPGNTLIIKRPEGKYDFYLVDLNRMKFHTKMDFETRMKNLSKITPKEDMVATMSNEYAKLSGINEDKVFSTMWNLTKDFQYRFYRKKRIKKRLKFWKK